VLAVALTTEKSVTFTT